MDSLLCRMVVGEGNSTLKSIDASLGTDYVCISGEMSDIT